MTFTVEQVQRIAGSGRAPEAAVALWAFLHGAVPLEAAQVLGGLKPESGLAFGFEAWLLATSEGGAVEQTSLEANQQESGEICSTLLNPQCTF